MKWNTIDIHCHTNFAVYDNDREDVIKKTLEAGVALINVGTQKDTSKSGVELTGQYESGVYATVGLHPIHTSATYHDVDEIGKEGKGFNSRGEEFDMEYYRALAQDPKVVAIGECGLDYFRPDPSSDAKQRTAFLSQIALANEVEKPLMLHIRNGTDGRNAYSDAYDILKSEARVTGNVHFFAGATEDAQKFLDLGFTCSFTGAITFPPRRTGAYEYKELVEYIPLDMMHAETDAPYVTPVPERGKRNEPLYVRHVVKKIADIKGLELEEVEEALMKNAERVFGV